MVQQQPPANAPDDFGEDYVSLPSNISEGSHIDRLDLASIQSYILGVHKPAQRMIKPKSYMAEKNEKLEDGKSRQFKFQNDPNHVPVYFQPLIKKVNMDDIIGRELAQIERNKANLPLIDKKDKKKRNSS